MWFSAMGLMSWMSWQCRIACCDCFVSSTDWLVDLMLHDAHLQRKLGDSLVPNGTTRAHAKQETVSMAKTAGGKHSDR